jgi:signal transduction histidine kinase
MKTGDQPLDNGYREGAVKDFDAQPSAAFFKTSAIGLAILDDQQRFQFVNNAVVAMHNSIPAEAFVGSTLRDIIGAATPEPEARFQRVFAAEETPAVEVTLMLPSRTELGYWIEKNFPVKRRSGRIVRIASLAVEVTAQRKLENRFRKLGGDLLWRSEDYQRLARELHDSIEQYHAALGMNLDRLSRCAREPERIPELLAQAMDLLDVPMQKLAAAIARCIPLNQH